VAAFRWTVDDAYDLEGMGGEVSTQLGVGQHQIVLLAEDQAGRQDRDTMLVNVLATSVGVSRGPDIGIPRLVFPVPYSARGGTTLGLSYELPEAGNVTITIHDMQGRIVRVLRNGEATSAGRHEATWDLRYRAGLLAPPGTYLCTLLWREVTVARKLVLLR
jgi:hypothetical protein